MGVLQEDNVGDIGAVPTCKHCGSERVARDAWACWNPESGLWELEQVFDESHCHQCEGATTFVWKPVAGEPRHAIRDLNDRFRRTGLGNGTVMITRGVQDRGPEFVQAAFQAVRSFDAFSEDNDPWGEHDFGAVEIDGEKLFWKLDLYEDDSVNRAIGFKCPYRVLTIMLAEEW